VEEAKTPKMQIYVDLEADLKKKYDIIISDESIQRIIREFKKQ
jgi:hypothetical protein